MKLAKIKKTVCLVLASAMLAAFVPMSAMAANGKQQVITATADSYIYQYSAVRTEKYASEDSMYFRRNGNNGQTGRYGAWPMVQFDLSDIKVDSGYQIDTVKITMHLKSLDNDGNASGTTVAAGDIRCYAANTEPTDYSTLSWDSYAKQLGYTDGDMPQSPSSNSSAMPEVDKVTLCPQNTLTPGDAYDFDVTDFVLSSNRTGAQTFVFYPYDVNHLNGYFYSLENGDSALVPTMTVTFKAGEAPATQTITALDTMWAGQNGSYENTDILSVQNNGTSASNRLAYVMFDMNDIAIPENKVITGAALQLYVANNYYYNDYSIERNVRIANVDDDNWVGPNCDWGDAPNTTEIRGGLSANGVTFSGIGAIGAGDKYYSFDVTEYLTNQYYTDEVGLASFAVHLDSILKRANNNVASVNIHGKNAANPPKLLLTYGDAADLAVTGVTFAEGYLGEAVTELGAKYTTNGNTITYANVAMSGAGSTGEKVNVFAAEYSEDGALVGVNVQPLDVYSANGTFTCSYYPQALPDSSYTKVFVWSSQLGTMLASPAKINTAEIVAEE